MDDITPFETPMAAAMPNGVRVVAVALHTYDEGIVYIPNANAAFDGHAACSACDEVWHYDFDADFIGWVQQALA